MAAPSRQGSSVRDTMAPRKEDQKPSASAEEQQRVRPRSEGDKDEHQEKGFSQAMSHEGAPPSPSDSGEVGIIESIQLENFMCHAKVGPLKFGSNVTFVVGRMGKSALLTALIAGLGGKSLGSSLREFVKDGKVLADIFVTLSNRGKGAFKSDVYGNSITVQKSIPVEGRPWYVLKDQVGNLVCTKKAEVMAILDHFNIRVDNPVCVLPQEMGHTLLVMRHDGERYKIFMKVTGLEEKRVEYSDILERKAKTLHELDQEKQQLAQLISQSLGLEEQFQKMVNLKQKLDELKHELAWTLVSETEKDLEESIKNIQFEDQHATILTQQLEASMAKYNESEKKYQEIEEKMQDVNEKATTLKSECTEAKLDAEKKVEAYTQAEADHNLTQTQWNQLGKVVEQLHSRIEDLKMTLEPATLEKQKKMSTLKEKLKRFKDQQDSVVQEVKALRRNIEKDREECFRMKKEGSLVEEKLCEQQRQISQWKESKSEPLKRFGPQIPPLLEAIADAHRQGHFTSKPIGPLGACIRLRDPDFALAIESCLKGLLLAFFCDNHKDEEILQDLIKRFYPPESVQPPIIVSAFECEVRDVTDSAAYHPDFPTVLTALEIDDAVVANTLIDMRGIESVLLIKSNSLARAVIHTQDLPQNCSKVLTACGDEVCKRHYYSCEELRPTYLGDVDAEISYLEREVENKMAHLSVYQQHMFTLEKDIKENEETVEGHCQHLKETKVQVINISTQIKDLEDEDDDDSIHLSVLEEEAQQYKQEMKEIQKKIESQMKEMESLRKMKTDAENIFEELKWKCDSISELFESVTGEQKQVAFEAIALHQSVLYYERRLKQHLSSLQVKKDDLVAKKREFERDKAMARHMSSEPKEVTRASSLVKEEIGMVKQTIQSENNIHGSQEEVSKKCQEVKERRLRLEGKVNDLKRFIKTLEEKATEKYALYQNHKTSFSLRCKMYFNCLLSQLSFCGEMDLDHEKEILSLTVQPKEVSGAAFSDMQSSEDLHPFANFLFILTLWSITESPFRCLDAFDTYIHQDHRKIAMDMILRLAHAQQHCQFILFTPQCMSSLPQSPLIEILQIPDPGRDERSLTCHTVKLKGEGDDDDESDEDDEDREVDEDDRDDDEEDEDNEEQ